MRCDYCGLALSIDDTGRFHPICADEASDAPLFAETVSSCPDGGCEACTPSEAS